MRKMKKFQFETLGGIRCVKTGEWLDQSSLICTVRALSQKLKNNSIDANSTVLICVSGRIGTIVSLFAVWSIGGTAAIVNAQSSDYEISELKKLTEASLVLIDEPRKLDSLSLPQILATPIDNIYKELDLNDSVLEVPCSARLILFTSGTTGKPKGVIHSISGLNERVKLNIEVIGTTALSNSLCVLPLHFGHGLIGNCLTPLLGGCNVIFAEPGLATSASFGNLVDEHSISFVSSVPSFWNLVLRLSTPPKMQSLQRVHVGSASLSSTLWRNIINWSGCPVVNTYGMTECANWISGASSADNQPVDGSVGKMWGGRAAVKLDDGEVVENGIGNLLISSPSLMLGYLEAPNVVCSGLSGIWFETGDIAEISVDGDITLLGRKTYQIKKAGIKILPEEIELLLQRHESINDVCAFKISDDIAGELVGVAVVLDKANPCSVEDLDEWLRKFLIKDKRPDHWFFVSKIGRKETGKINRTEVGRLAVMEHKLGETKC